MSNESFDTLMDQLSHLFREVEDYFDRHDYVLPAMVKLPMGDNLFLAYGKLSNEWCLYVTVVTENKADRKSWPLLNASAEQRQHAVGVLDALEEQLKHARDGGVATAREHVHRLQAWLQQRGAM